MTNSSTNGDEIFEEREEELMVSLVGGREGGDEGNNPILRRAHFLKPIVSCIHGAELPAGVPLTRGVTTLLEPTNWPVKLKFRAWRSLNNEWNTWVFRMESKHGNAWRRAGVYHAIMNTSREIHRYDELVLGLAEKWSLSTNTFIFPWGEATITLEDVMVLGGYSVLGSSVSCSVQNREEWKGIEEKLLQAGREIQKSQSRKVCQFKWNKKFVGGGSEIEHEAFLSLWLSRFVFQRRSAIINQRVFPLAILLARGIEVALAPAVLSSIYAELSLLKRLLVRLEKNDEFDGVQVFSPFQLVLLWAWERFQELQPYPNVMSLGDSRLARWDRVETRRVGNVRLALEMAGESFLWRPYSKIVQNWQFPEFYKEKEDVVLVDSGLDTDFVSFAHCLRVSNLVGLDGVQMQSYFPNRVAMQFRFDQDVPGKCVGQSGKKLEVGSANYCEAIMDTKIYIPSRLFEPKVSVRYLEWWKRYVLGQQDVVEGSVKKERSLQRSKLVENPDAYDSKLSVVFKLVVRDDHETEAEPDVPPGFLPKHKLVVDGNSVDGDGPAGIRKLSKGSENRRPISDGGAPKSSSGLSIDNASMNGGAEPISDGGAPKSSSGLSIDNASMNGGAEGGESSHKTRMPGLELEARITWIEQEIAKLKAARLAIPN